MFQHYKRMLFLALWGFLLLQSCTKGGKTPPINNAIDLDGTQINDSSLTYPDRFLLSAALPNPSPSDLAKPVIICVHGFSATTFEWIEFRDYSKAYASDYLTSLVLLGGHGRDYTDFKAASWEDWQTPIITEYEKLVALGYTNISIVGSSAGGALSLDLILNNKLNFNHLKNVILVDPIVVPSNKTLTIVKAVGPLLSYSETVMEQGENGFWYKYRPYQALNELNELTKKIRRKIQKGNTLPKGVELTVFKSEKDGSADPISAAIIEKGIKLDNGNNITTYLIDSDLHVFTRLKGRNSYSNKDIVNQNFAFSTIRQLLN